MSWRKLRTVTRFELAEALRSRLVVVVLSLYGAGAALGAYGLSKALHAVEEAARASLPESLSPHDIPDDVVRRQVLPRLPASLVEDPALREELGRIDLLAVFYGFMALQLVALLVLMTSSGAHASDVARGASRFVLTRCDRLSWALGKLLGHAALLALGLVVGAAVTLAVGFGQGHFDAPSAIWLMRASFRAWIYGLAHLGMFAGISLVLKVPAAARVFSVLLLFGLALGHAVVDSDWMRAALPVASYGTWLFPAQYKLLLWSPRWHESAAASLALLGLGGAAFALGHQVFRRGDA